jgi:hypothetical protein
MLRALFEWEGQEYERDEKGADWYWAMGIVAAALAIAAILFANYLLALLIVVAAATVALHAAKHPPLHKFMLTDEGLVIDNDLHPYQIMQSFTVFEYIEGDRPPMLSIKMESWLSPHLVVPLEKVDVDAVYAHLLHHVDESAHEHSLADLVAGWLRF